MKRLLILFAASALLLPSHISAERKAVTQDGKTVILFDNGTWRFESDSQKKDTKKNSHRFSRPSSAKQSVSGEKNNYRLWFNEDKWTKLTMSLNEVSEYSFRHKGGDAFCMIIPENTEFDINILKDLVLQNAKTAAPNAVITYEEIRNVNGKELLHIELKGTISNIKFIYYNYLYSGKSGSIQIITFTTEKMFDEYRKDMEDILNGFEITGTD